MRRDEDDLLRGFLALNALLREELRDVRRLVDARTSETKYNPNWRWQPRAPVGTREGGRWIDGGKVGGPKRSTRRTTPPRRPPEPRVDFFDEVNDNPYIWELSERGLLPSDASVADFFNLRYELGATRGPAFTEVARSVGMSASQLHLALDRGASVMSERATDTIERIFDNPGIAGVNIAARDQALRRYVRLSGVRPEYEQRMFRELLDLAGYTEEEYEQRQRDVIAEQLPFMVGVGGPQTPRRLPRARVRASGPRSVWRLGPATRGRIIEAARGHNLHANFPVIDRFARDGTATSIKSIDLAARTYLRSRSLERRLRGFVDQLAGFNGRTFANDEIVGSAIRRKVLEVVVPNAGTAAQQAVIETIRTYARSRQVDLHVIIYL